jgi:RHS repeat-associated protein
MQGGQRVVKKAIHSDGSSITTYYIRDAGGNVMGVYEYNIPPTGTTATAGNSPVLAEQYIYGSSRIGVCIPNANAATQGGMGARFFGMKSYEITDHLGNVRVTLSDYESPISPTSIVNSAVDYYPFGMVAIGRTYSNPITSSYRYGFSGKEINQELNGDYDFGARIYDPRLGRWLSLDPMFRSFPIFSPYTFVNNNPLRFIDPSGGFLLDVHQRIAENALRMNGAQWGFRINFGAYGVGNSMYSKEAQNDVKNNSFMFGIVGQGTVFSGGVTDPDWNDADNKSAHFDQMNFDQIIQNYSKLNTRTTELVNQFKSGTINEEQFGFEIGKQLHSIQDLYSHSNYIELYIAKYGKPTDPTTIPTLKEVMSNSKYADFAKSLKTTLKTGEYPGKGPNSHKAMNHDVGAGSNYTNLVGETRGKEVTYESIAAEAVATKASVELLNEVKTQVETPAAAEPVKK